ncbi:hypothetical protein GH714_029885 [Hevea brasiliensis]|uniref:Trichome birefringence-like C-terminal domain-containing protein n=1 Tax=Hevea brasiliensis TaxID=3981 RepID=A0A6A6N746_HEVBR|nr:hypothetical protein GH714_029885 [Hevea brasiliensis]
MLVRGGGERRGLGENDLVTMMQRWGHDKFPNDTPFVFYHAGQQILPSLGLFDGFKVVLENMVSYIQKEVPGKTFKFWRLQSQRHFYGSEWNQNGSCLFSEALNENETMRLGIYLKLAFGEGHGAVMNPNLIKIGKEMVKKCKGVPLAIRSLGSLMHLKTKESSLPEVLEETHWGLNSPLPSLMYLSLSNNHLVGSISEVHFSKLNKLKFLGLSSNSFFSNVSSNWVPPFQVQDLEVDVDLSSNFLEGPTPLSTFEIELLELSNNRFSGPIPEKLAQSMPNLVFLSLSGNSLSGSIPSSIGNCSLLNAMDLSFKNLSGEIPLSFSRLNQLRSLHLSNNKLTGSLPSSFQNLSNLETLDLGNNRLSCEIPPWIGSGFADLRILSLRSNAFFGEIPSTLSNLSSLQILDLAKNNLAGSIPVTFGDYKAMSLEQYINEYLPYGKYRGVYYEESLIVNIKVGLRSIQKLFPWSLV